MGPMLVRVHVSLMIVIQKIAATLMLMIFVNDVSAIMPVIIYRRELITKTMKAMFIWIFVPLHLYNYYSFIINY